MFGTKLLSQKPPYYARSLSIEKLKNGAIRYQRYKQFKYEYKRKLIW
jgi:hypothetical protein